MMSNERFYSTATERLTKASSRAVLGLRAFRNKSLREYLRDTMEQAPGEPQALLSDPVFEAAFGWEECEKRMQDLSGDLLHAELVNALANPVNESELVEDHSFPADRYPYRHQLEAWEALIDDKHCRSAIVTSGTGSGKTECFLIPILNDLTGELIDKQDSDTEGVRALFLYPLNALIKSQQERLLAWSEPFKGRIRFCLYNGDTRTDAKSTWSCEVAGRRELREHPPQLLVTNPTMLEYMLVRGEDRPILEKSQGKLRWIVIDEAHTYMGSQAAELTLLLRRTMHAFGCEPGQVHVIATSATIADSTDDSANTLARFLADIAGVSENQVTVVAGRRSRPSYPQEGAQAITASVRSFDHLEGLQPQALFDELSSNQIALRLRNALIEQPRRLAWLSQHALGQDDAGSRRDTLGFLDLCSRARSGENEPFLPLRGHLFHRTIAGLWACADSQCTRKNGTFLADGDWPFGTVYFERRERCECGSPVFEVVQCSGCGGEYLNAAEYCTERGVVLVQPPEQRDDDEFRPDLEPPDEGAEDEGAEDQTADYPQASGANVRRRLVTEPGSSESEVSLNRDGVIDFEGQEGIKVHLILPDEERLECAVCHERDQPGHRIRQFKPVFIGAPFHLLSTTPTLLGMQPTITKQDESHPLEGRRLVSFTDSRQGTARTVMSLQQQGERDYVGSLLYHSLSDQKPKSAATVEEIQDKEKEIAALRPLVEKNPSLQSILDRSIDKLEKLRRPAIGSLSWQDATAKLQSSHDFQSWVSSDMKGLSYSSLNDRDITDLCLYREFFFRPRRQHSLEGLGLLKLHYPGLEQAKMPAVLEQRGIERAQWIDLLTLTVDTFIRSGAPAVEIPENIRRWLGYPGRPSILIAPYLKKQHRSQRVWPLVSSSHARRNRLVKLVCHVFDLNPQEKHDADLGDEILSEIWRSLVDTGVLSSVEGGYQLILSRNAELRTLDEAWLCPVTRRLLPVSFKGVTPYLPMRSAAHSSTELTQCERVRMPALEDPFWNRGGSEAARDWLENDKDIQKLRKLGAWNNRSDRIAAFTRYFRTAEHSAQLSGVQLSRHERDFKQGKINLLSCSTTMEMGVDIGGLSGVIMNNVPPHPANFLQRAGRAGRRGESSAVSFTLCKATPHGEAVFRNPLWAFTEKIAAPRVDLRSIPIVQRHINALVIATFLLEVEPDRVTKLHTGWFFESDHPDQAAPIDKFITWCGQPDRWPARLADGVESVLRGSALEGLPVDDLMDQAAAEISSVRLRWDHELEGLLSQYDQLKTKDGKSKPEQALDIRLDRWRREYLLGYLASEAFLPGYGFPSGVVPLVTTTRDEIKEEKRVKDEEEDRPRQRRAGFPTRSLDIAIRDYAPGTDTVINGRVYRSSGVTLNWHVPVEAEAEPEIQDLRWLWQCRSCQGNGLKLSKPEMCPACGNRDLSNLTIRRLLLPAGFAVDFGSSPHNDISTPQYIPVRDPLISIDGSDWMMLPASQLGRYRTSRAGRLIHRSDGLFRNGYSLCLRCGRADSVTFDGERPNSLRDHRRLQGGKRDDREKLCPGNEESWAIQDGLYLGASYLTEVFELQLHDLAGRPVRTPAAAYTLAVALRRAFCALVGIDESELGAAKGAGTDPESGNIYSIYLFDKASGGAGYSSQVPGLLIRLMRRVRDEVLQCPKQCDSACQACLLTYETQHNIDDLDRHAALRLLSADYLDAIDLPSEMRAYGKDSQSELEPLTLALEREWQNRELNEIRLYLGGDADDWEPLQWRLRDPLRRLHEKGVGITLVVEESVFKALTDSQRDELFVIATELDATLVERASFTKLLPGNTFPIMEAGGPEAKVRWGSSKANTLAPNEYWGSGEEGAVFVRSSLGIGPLPEITGANLLDISRLRSMPEPGAVDLVINRELSGPVSRFGAKAWDLIAQSVPELDRRLQSDDPIVKLVYTDRYLRSPLSILLIDKLIGSLESMRGGLNANSNLKIISTDLGRPHPRPPAAWFHDWQDPQDREEVIRGLFSERFGDFSWEASRLHDVAHARLLSLCWADGEKWEIRLDQGLGYWQASQSPRSWFPFGRSASEQLRSLRAADIEVREASTLHPTYWYIVKSNAA